MSKKNATVDELRDDLTRTRTQVNSRGRGFAPSRTVVLNFSHCLWCPLIFHLILI